MKKILSLVLTVAMLATLCLFTGVDVSASETQWNGEAATAFSDGGDGTKENPYKIGTAGELKLFANIVNGKDLTGSFTQNEKACGILTADIVLNVGDLSGYNGTDTNSWVAWVPIGLHGDNSRTYFRGVFNGNGHTVSGLYFNTNQDSAGLFGYTNSDASISNLGIINSYIKGNSEVGGICGSTTPKTTVKNCYNEAAIIAADECCGGIVGDNYGTVENCYNTGAITAGIYAGGVCGNNYGTVSGCYNTGTVSCSAYAGGVCGASGYKSIIEYCYNTGNIQAPGGYSVGGVVGYIRGAAVRSCYNTGTVVGSRAVGGAIGEKVSYGEDEINVIENCYYLDTCGAAGDDGVSKTMVQFTSGELGWLLNAQKYVGDIHWYTSGEGSMPTLDSTGYIVKYENGVYSLVKNEGVAVEYIVIPTYMVTIPAEVSLGGEAIIEAENVILDEGKQLEVELTSTSGDGNAFTVTNGKTSVLEYAVTVGDIPVSVGGTVLTVNPANGANGSAALVFSSPLNAAKYSGDYSGTLTFTVSVKRTKFNITLAPDDMSPETVTFIAETGMTWREWIASGYNTDGWVVDNYNYISTDANDDENTKWLGVTTGAYDERWHISADAEPDDIITSGTVYVLFELS